MVSAKHLLTCSIIVCFVVNSCYCVENDTNISNITECKILAFDPPQANSSDNNNNYGSLCNVYVKIDRGYYKNCRILDKNKNDSVKSLCIDLMNNQCGVEIYLSNAINHQQLSPSYPAPSNCSGRRTYTFILNSIRLSDLNSSKRLFLFDNYPSLDIFSNTVTDSTFGDPIPPSLMLFLRSAKYLEWNKVRFNSPLEGMVKESRVEYFTMENSTINGISKNCFVLGPNVKKVKLKDNTIIGGGKIATGSFVISSNSNQCQEKRSLTIENLGLTQTNVDVNFIKIQEANRTTTECAEPMQLTLTGNNFAHTIPERIFSPFLHDVYQQKMASLSLRFDKIDCCIRDNKWLFDLLNDTTNTTQGTSTKLQIDCNDIDANVYNLTTLIERDDLCYYRNVYPILLIAIISILILVILMAVFSYICVYHVLKKRGQVIMLGGPSNISGGADRANPNYSSEPIEIRSTQTDVPKAKSPAVSSGIWAKLKSVRFTRSQAPPPGPKEVRLPKTGFKLPGFKNLDAKELAARRKHEGQAKRRSHEAGIARKSPHPHPHHHDHAKGSHLGPYRTESSIPEGPSVAGGKGVAGGSKLVAKHKTVAQSPQQPQQKLKSPKSPKPDSKQSNLDELATKRSSDVKRMPSDTKKVSSATKQPSTIKELASKDKQPQQPASSQAPATNQLASAVKTINTDNDDSKSNEADRMSSALKTTNY